MGGSSPIVTDTKQVEEMGLARPIIPEAPKAQPEQPERLKVRRLFCCFSTKVIVILKRLYRIRVATSGKSDLYFELLF